MALEATPASVATDGNLRITFVDDAANPLSVADLDTGVDITYSLTPSGFTHTVNENSVDDPRLTLKQTFNSPGTSTFCPVVYAVAFGTAARTTRNPFVFSGSAT